MKCAIFLFVFFTCDKGTPRKYKVPNIPGSSKPKKLKIVIIWVSDDDAIEKNDDLDLGGFF